MRKHRMISQTTEILRNVDKNNFKLWVSKNAPSIYTGISTGSLLLAITLAANEGKAVYQELEEISAKSEDDITFWKRVEIHLKHYYPSYVAAAISIITMWMANKEGAKRLDVMSAAYLASQAKVKDLKEDFKEALGEKKYAEVRSKDANEKIDRAMNEYGSPIITGKGDVLGVDDWTYRPFLTSKVSVDTAVNAINERLIHGEMFIPVNDFYYELGLRNAGCGVDFGWTPDNLLEVEIDWTCYDDKPAMLISFNVTDRYSFRR